MFEDEQQLILLREYSKEGNLVNYIEDKKKIKSEITDEEASQIIRQLLEGLQYLHSLNIIHGSIKPENIFLEHHLSPDSVKLSDYRNASLFSNKLVEEEPSRIRFLPPEALKEEEIEMKRQSSDIWSCGMVMYYLLSQGKHAIFDGTESFFNMVAKLRCLKPK